MTGLFLRNPMRDQTASFQPALVSRRQVLAGVASTALGATVLRGHAAAVATAMSDDHVVELRQYTLRKGGRDTLIRMFEEHFLEPQNALGAHVIGTFRDLDD